MRYKPNFECSPFQPKEALIRHHDFYLDQTPSPAALLT